MSKLSDPNKKGADLFQRILKAKQTGRVKPKVSHAAKAIPPNSILRQIEEAKTIDVLQELYPLIMEKQHENSRLWNAKLFADVLEAYQNKERALSA